MYFMFNSLFGSVGVMLRSAHQTASTSTKSADRNDANSVGWQRIRQVAVLRKQARKLRQK